MKSVLIAIVLALSCTPMFGADPAAAKPAAKGKPAAPDPKKKKLPKLTPAFAPGERLTYKIVWNKIPVGELRVYVDKDATIRGQDAWHFVMEAVTNDYADKIYKVRTYIHSYVSKDLRRSLRYVSRQLDGKGKKWVLLDFYWDKNKVKYMKTGVDRGLRPVKPNALDSLAMFYYVRALDYAGRKRIEVRVSDGKRCVDSGADIVKREKVKANGKEYNAYLVEPDLKDLRGVFKKSKNAKLQLWISDDQDRVPVKIASEVVVGRFYATLIKHEKPEINKDAETGKQ